MLAPDKDGNEVLKLLSDVCTPRMYLKIPMSHFAKHNFYTKNS